MFSLEYTLYNIEFVTEKDIQLKAFFYRHDKEKNTGHLLQLLQEDHSAPIANNPLPIYKAKIIMAHSNDRFKPNEIIRVSQPSLLMYYFVFNFSFNHNKIWNTINN